LLKNLPVRVVKHSDEQKMLDSLCAGEADVLLIDFSSRGLYNAFIKRIGGPDALHNLPVIRVSSNGDIPDFTTNGWGHIGHLHKPFMLDELVTALMDAIEHGKKVQTRSNSFPGGELSPMPSQE
jgi:DNA-binding NtrC family response regulator